MSAYLLNPWAFVQFAHNQLAAVVTGSFVVAAIGAFYALRGVHPVQARLYLRAGTFVGFDRVAPSCLSNRRRASQDGWSSSTDHARGDGGKVSRADKWRELLSLANRMFACSASRTIRSKSPARSVFSPTDHFGSFVHGTERLSEKINGRTTSSFFTTHFTS
jgi:hypothetical protein